MASRARNLAKSVHSSEQAEFCTLMIEARKRAGLTQQQLADRLRRPQSFVAKYEGGERRLDVLEFVTIAKAVGADPVSLIKRLIGGKLGA
jgi:transcriptional regulator with XRE-family HTH domain